MKQLQSFCERYGVWMVVFSLLFTFAYSLFYEIDISNHDYLFYMHYVDSGSYDQTPMVAGTIFLSKPLWFLFGRQLLLWKIWAWTMACLTAMIPFFTLLNADQRKRYAYILALVVVVLNLRFGLEPPQYVYLFNTIMLTCFIKYIQDKKYGWVVAISLCLALITFVRFPSLFAWPVVILAMLIMRANWKHIATAILLPVLFFMGLVTITNGGINTYLVNLASEVGTSASGGHSIMSLFLGYVTSTTHAIAYATLICLPIFLYGIWKRKRTALSKIAFAISAFVITAIMAVHPTEHLSCALTIAAVVVYSYYNHWNLTGIVLGGTIVITNMFCSVGSDCGFVHEYYCVSFLPFLMGYFAKDEERKYTPIFTTIVMILLVSTFANKSITLGKAYRSGIVDGRELSTNLSGVYFAKQSMQRYTEMQKEYLSLKDQYDEVIYWGTYINHLMSFANNQWPVTDIWNISSRDTEGKPYRDFVEYVSLHKPAVIDLEKHANTKAFMSSQGYELIPKDFANIYVLR